VSEAAEDEVDKIVENVVNRRGAGKKKPAARAIDSDGDGEESKVDDAEMPSPMASARTEKADRNDLKPITLEQLEALHTVVPDLPKPVENVKMLGDLVSKYSIGQRPEFRLQVHRTWPKIFFGGRKADGFLDDYDQPIDEAFISNEYGGGEYLVRVVGPKSGTNIGTQHYESVRVNIQGEPKMHRVSRAQQTMDAKDGGASAAASFPTMMMPPSSPREDPKIVESTLGALKEVIVSERARTERAEDRADVGIQEARQLAQPIIEAEQRRANDVTRLTQERFDAEKKAMEDRLAMERERAEERYRLLEKSVEDQRRSLEEQLRKVHEMENNRPSLASEFRELMSAMPQPPPPPPPQPPQRGELELAGKVIDQSAEKHRAEMDAMRQQQQSMIESLRSGHEREIAATREANSREIAALREQQTTRDARQEEQLRMERAAHDREIASLREAGARELQSERESWKHREQRFEEQIKNERDERRRDQDRARDQQNERDQAAKDRQDQAEERIKQQYEARISMIETNHAERVRWLQQEIDTKVREIGEVRSKLQDTHDPVAQMARFREFREAAQHGLGLVENTPVASSSSSSSSSGIGLSGSGLDVNEVVQTIAERGPELLTALGSLVRGPAAPQQQGGGMVPGQMVETPMGPMMVVQTEHGPRLTPVGAAPAPARLLPAGEPKPRQPAPAPRQPMPPGGMVHGDPRPAPVRRKRGGSANFDPLPNLAEGLPHPIPPWEKKPGPFAGKPSQAKPQAPAQQQPPQQQLPQGAPQQPQAPQAAGAARPEKVPMNAIEKQIAQMVAKMIHEAVVSGDEPEDFVDKIMDGDYPTAILEGLAAKSDQEILAGIAAVEPRSAGVSPGGQQFVRASMALLREELAREDESE